MLAHVEGPPQGHLLLIHGMVDENVHFRHTSRLITALTQAGKPYDAVLFPEERHMPRRLGGSGVLWNAGLIEFLYTDIWR